MVVMKNWDPLVLGPALAIERSPGLVCLSLKLSTRANRQYRRNLEIVAVSSNLLLVSELLAVDRLSTSSVVAGEVTSLEHDCG